MFHRRKIKMNPVCCTIDTCEVSCTTCNCCGGPRVRRGSNNDEEESTLRLADEGNNDEEKAKIETWSSLSSSAGDIAPDKNNSFVSSKVSSVPSIFGLGNGSNVIKINNEYSEEEIQSTGKLQVRRRSSLFKANSCPVICVNDRRLSVQESEVLRENKEKLVRDWLETHHSPSRASASPKKRIKSGKSAASVKLSKESLALAEVFPGLTQEELEPDEDSLDEFFGTKNNVS